jgi:hypothetical protein
MKLGSFISLAFIAVEISHAFVTPSSRAQQHQDGMILYSSVTDAEKTKTQSDVVSKSPIFEYLKFDKAPSFDVVGKTKEYVEMARTKEPYSFEEIYDKDYVLRGPVIGPINRKDLQASQKGLGLFQAFSNIELSTFGYTVDPENPYRCFYFQRWRAVNDGDLDAYGDIFPATGAEVETPVATFCVVWTPEGKIIYEQVGAVVDRFEGNTAGKAAVFGLLHAAGLKLPASPGSATFSFIQRLGHVLGGRGRSWSKDEEVPAWWTSKSRGADGTD